MPQTISLLGCGWLGWPLGKLLVQNGWIVKGSTTSPEKIPHLESSGINPFLITINPSEHYLIQDQKRVEFFNSSHLFLNIPFRRGLSDPFDYFRQMEAVIHQVNHSPIDFVIFTSSTAVYPASVGWMTEADEIIPDNDRSHVLLNIEQLLFEQTHFQTTVLRLGGLYGAERKIGAFLAGRTKVPEGNGPVNLVHRDDCTQIILQVIIQNIRGEIFNVVSDAHPAHKELYTQAAVKAGLPPPEFDETKPGPTKRVSNEKIKMRLGYRFKYPDPLKDL